MSRLKTAVVGCGAVAFEEHVPALKEMPDVELVALVDEDVSRARSLAARHRVPRTFARFDELLEEVRPELVVVLTPPESHAGLARTALEAGAHVLVECPFVYTKEEADAVIGAASAAGRKLSVVHNELFHYGIREMNDRIRAGAVGTVGHVEYIAGQRDQSSVPSRWYYNTRGGRLGERLPHALYQLTEFFDDLEVGHVEARRLGRSLLPPGVSEVSVDFDQLSVMLYSSGRKATAHLTTSTSFELPTTILVAGSEGSLITHPERHAVTVARQSPGIRELLRTLPDWGDAVRRRLGSRLQDRVNTDEERLRRSSHSQQIREFVTAIRAGTPYTVTPAKAREVVRLWEEIVARYSTKDAGRPRAPVS